MIVDQAEFSGRAERLAQLYQEAARILDALDELGLYQAGGYLSMTMDAILQAQWEGQKPG